MNAVQIREELLKNVGAFITVTSACDNTINKGFLKRHNSSWQVELMINGKKQIMYFSACIVEIVEHNPFAIRLKNKR